MHTTPNTNNRSLVAVGATPHAFGQRKALWMLVPLALAWFALVAAFSYFQGRQAQPVGVATINVGPVMVVEPWTETPLPIQLAPPESIPPRGWLRIGGLPVLATLSAGYVIKPGVWVVPISGIPTLKLRAPPTEGGKAEIAIALLSADGVALTEARSLLVVIPELHARDTAAGAAGAPAAPAPAWIWAGAKEEARSLMRRGDEALSSGNVGAARSMYEYAATQMHWPTGALALAATYDPNELAHLAPRLTPDPEQARFWYVQAQELGNARIDFYLRRLGPPRRRDPAPP